MSTAAVAADAPKKGSKKLIIIIAAVVLLAVLGAGAMLMMKGQHAEDEEGGEGEAKAAQSHAAKPGTPPVFVPIDTFTVNLIDKEQDRYLQVGLTMEVADAATGDKIKAYMPAIRNAILMILSRKSSEELLAAEGKAALATEVRVATARAMGYDIEDEHADEAADDDTPRKKKKKKKRVDENPITAVHYSNFIIQ